ncbi:hypothetical protein HDU67_006822 [Dinochytrium kinnereticum]|nr:hypothetical protein HDU67_006822 [Dinochytrium kinnereticum]
MAAPLRYRKGLPLHPFGDFPAANLVEYLAPEKCATVLLLGCGDPRDILFTIHHVVGRIASENGFKVDLDFTCCDFEPAVLARNILLFTLFSHDVSDLTSDSIWNIFFHRRLDQESLKLMWFQCRKLVERSQDIEAWNTSPYGGFIRMCSQRTLAQVSSVWTHWLHTQEMSKSQKKKFRKKFEDALVVPARMHSNVEVGTSGSPFQFHRKALGEHFSKTGTTSCDPDALEGAAFPNPTMCYSVDGPVRLLKAAIDPLLGFHLDFVFTNYDSAAGTNDRREFYQQCVVAAKSQFSQWMTSFKRALEMVRNTGTENHLMIRVFAGDALALGMALQYISSTGSSETGYFTSSSSSTPLNLDTDDYGNFPGRDRNAPLMFNVIDASTLAEEVGFLNLFVASSPLLKVSPSSVFYTNVIQPSNLSLSAVTQFHTCCDAITFAALFGVEPLVEPSCFSSKSFLTREQDDMKWVRLPWKIVGMEGSITSKGDLTSAELPMLFDRNEMAYFLHHFFTESSDASRKLEFLKNIKSLDTKEMDLGVLQAQGFTLLLLHLKGRVYSGWNGIMSSFCSLLAAENRRSELVDYFLDLRVQMHIHGVHPVNIERDFKPEFNYDTSNGFGKLSGWARIPYVVCIVFQVPRANLDSLSELDHMSSWPLFFHCEIEKGERKTAITALQVCYGRIQAEGERENLRVVITDEPSGDLVVSFWGVPAIVMGNIETTKLSLCAVVHVTGKSPKMKKVAEFSVSDKAVMVSPYRPNNPSEIEKLKKVPSGRVEERSVVVEFFFGDKCKEVTGFIVAVNCPELKSSEMNVRVVPVSSCEASVLVRGREWRVRVPYPVNFGKAQVAVMKGRFEIDVDILRSKRSRLSNSYFPITQDKAQAFTPWNFHRISLQDCPLLPRQTNDLWLKSHLSNASPVSSNILQYVHHTVSQLILQVARDGDKGLPVALMQPNNRDVHTLIFSRGLRVDEAGGTVVVDALVLGVREEVRECVGKIMERGVVRLFTDEEERNIWEQFLCVVVERCRSFRHGLECEWRGDGDCSLSGQICSCSTGTRQIEDAIELPEWSAIAPFVSHAAISPLFVTGGSEDEDDVETVSDVEREFDEDGLDELRAGTLRRDDYGDVLIMGFLRALCGVGLRPDVGEGDDETVERDSGRGDELVEELMDCDDEDMMGFCDEEDDEEVMGSEGIHKVDEEQSKMGCDEDNEVEVEKEKDAAVAVEDRAEEGIFALDEDTWRRMKQSTKEEAIGGTQEEDIGRIVENDAGVIDETISEKVDADIVLAKDASAEKMEAEILAKDVSDGVVDKDDAGEMGEEDKRVTYKVGRMEVKMVNLIDAEYVGEKGGVDVNEIISRARAGDVSDFAKDDMMMSGERVNRMEAPMGLPKEERVGGIAADDMMISGERANRMEAPMGLPEEERVGGIAADDMRMTDMTEMPMVDVEVTGEEKAGRVANGGARVTDEEAAQMVEFIMGLTADMFAGTDAEMARDEARVTDEEVCDFVGLADGERVEASDEKDVGGLLEDGPDEDISGKADDVDTGSGVDMEDGGKNGGWDVGMIDERIVEMAQDTIGLANVGGLDGVGGTADEETRFTDDDIMRMAEIEIKLATEERILSSKKEEKMDDGQEESAPACFICKATSDMRCSRCKKAFYCGAFCQRLDWKRHRRECGF